MQHFRFEDMIGGWFVGGFSPTSFSTDACEVAVKFYSAGQTEDAHFHKVATEVTLVQSGQVRMMERRWGAGDIIVLAPGETTSFEAITDAVNVVIKLPGALGDKYFSDGTSQGPPAA